MSEENPHQDRRNRNEPDVGRRAMLEPALFVGIVRVGPPDVRLGPVLRQSDEAPPFLRQMAVTLT
jgi:hypothetical protein